jgi:putative transposase
VNIDESNFSKAPKKNYSWLKRGVACTINNAQFTNSMSVISCIMSNGVSGTTPTTGRINSQVFMSYLKTLFKFIESNTRYDLSKVILIMDNAQIHKAKIIEEFLKESNIFFVHFLPAYTPELAPVEMCFARMKQWLDREGGLAISAGTKTVERRNFPH